MDEMIDRLFFYLWEMIEQWTSKMLLTFNVCDKRNK